MPAIIYAHLQSTNLLSHGKNGIYVQGIENDGSTHKTN